MILIVHEVGTELIAIPKEEVIEYKKLDTTKLGMLPIFNKNQNCTKIYVPLQHRSNIKQEAQTEKLVFYRNTDDLYNLLDDKPQTTSRTQEKTIDNTPEITSVPIEIINPTNEIEELQPALEKVPIIDVTLPDEEMVVSLPTNEVGVSLPIEISLPIEVSPPNNEVEPLEEIITLNETGVDDLEELETTEESTDEKGEILYDPSKEEEHDFYTELVDDSSETISEEKDPSPIQWVGADIDIPQPIPQPVQEVVPVNTQHNEGYLKELQEETEKLQKENELLRADKLKLASKQSELYEEKKHLEETMEQMQQTLAQVTNKLDSALVIADNRLKQQKETYDERIRIANETIQNLTEKLLSDNVSESTKKCSIFSDYVVEPRAVVHKPLTEGEKLRVGQIRNTINVVSVRGTDSMTILQESIMALINTDKSCLIADFTGDFYLNQKYKITPRYTVLDIERQPLKDIVLKKGNIDYVPTTSFNDIALLTMNWDVILNSLIQQAGDRPIIIMVNDIEYFSTRFIVSRLGVDIAQVSILLKATPYNIVTVQSSKMFLPNIKKKLLIMDYKHNFDGVVQKLSAAYTIEPFDDKLDWSTLGIG